MNHIYHIRMYVYYMYTCLHYTRAYAPTYIRTPTYKPIHNDFLNHRIWGQVANPLPRCLIFQPTVYGQCTHYSWVG